MDDTNTSNKRSLDLQQVTSDEVVSSSGAISSGTELKETYRTISDEGNFLLS